MGRGAPRKECPKCGILNHARRSKCEDCGHWFETKRKTIKNEITEWKQLQKGDKIKIVGGGPYYYSKDNQRRTYVGTKGAYVVSSIEENGIHVVSTLGSHHFLYMGQKYISEETGLHHAPYRIAKA